MTRTRRVALVVIAVALAGAALAYLREPPWLARMNYGFRGWQTEADGTRYRWTGGHASFFVPATAASVSIPIRTTFGRGDPAVLVAFTIDDRPANAIVLREPAWQRPTLNLPPPGRRGLRRIDVRVDRLREGNRGVQIGEWEIR
jgi:hypothetical protein